MKLELEHNQVMKMIDGTKVHHIVDPETQHEFANILTGTAISVFKKESPDTQIVPRCLSTQDIVIADGIVFVDKRRLPGAEVYHLAKNEGFDEATDFMDAYPKPFKGTIIHFTTLVY